MEIDWRIVFYRSGSGNAPVIEFLDEQDEETRDRIYKAFERLRIQNTRASYPLVRPIEDKLWELRVEQRTNIYRVFYFFWTSRQIVMLHAFQKKTQKTPNQEIQIAQKRMSEFL